MKTNRRRRRVRIRARLVVTRERPRLSVFRSQKHVSGQISDQAGRVLVTATDKHLAEVMKGTARAHAVGKLIAERALEKNIRAVVFDKGEYRYHGHVKAFADGARAGGLSF